MSFCKPAFTCFALVINSVFSLSDYLIVSATPSKNLNYIITTFHHIYPLRDKCPPSHNFSCLLNACASEGGGCTSACRRAITILEGCLFIYIFTQSVQLISL